MVSGLLIVLLVSAAAGTATAAALTLSTTSLSFVTVAGTSPAPQQFTASTTVGGFTPQVTATTQTGDWLAVSAAAGGSFAASVDVLVTVKSSSLAVGDYTGQITVSQAGLDGSPATVAVSLKVIPAVPYLRVTPNPLNVAVHAGSDPGSLAITIENSGSGSIAPTVSATTSDGTSWLAVSQPTGGTYATSVTAKVDIHSASLAAGAYTGTITVASTGALNSPLNVPVNLTVGATTGPTISVSPPSLSFLAGLGANPRAQSLTITNAGTGTLRPTTQASGGSWLFVGSPIGGSFASSWTVGVQVDLTGLAKGTYNGTATVSDPNSTNGSVMVPVLLTLTDPQPILSVSDSWIVISMPANSTAPMAALIYVSNLGTGAMPWTATVTSGAAWLSVDPTSGTAAFTSSLRVLADPTGLAAGLYNGEITVTATNAVPNTLNPQKIKVTLAIATDLPAPSDNGVVNAASFTSHTPAPGAIIAIFGDRLGPDPAVTATSYVSGKLPTILGGVQVQFTYADATGTHQVYAPLYYAGKVQVNAFVPLELQGISLASIQVICSGVPSRTMPIYLQTADPGIFQFPVPGGSGGYTFLPVITDMTYQLIGASNPAKPGDWLVIWATGLGPVNGALETGAPAPGPPNPPLETSNEVKVNFGGSYASVIFAGLTPGTVGLYQINVQVPATAKSGNNSVIVAIGTRETAPATVPVR
jgi:uncharacterized protein (TIGR03437 family)